MPQPQAYSRVTDFASRAGNDTDHNALNQEFDGAALTLNQVRAALALIQKDDGALANGIVTALSLAPSAFEAVQGSVTSATANAQASATSALTSAGSAIASKDAAAASAASALTSQTASGLNATSASTSGAAALTSKNDAAASAASALVSKDSATASAAATLADKNAAAAAAAAALADKNTATTAATNALASEGAAATAATSAVASFDSFDDRYLGSKAVAPTLDNDGAALLTGALYWDSPLSAMRVWTAAGAWLTIPNASASSTTFAPVGSIAAATVQGAIAELDASINGGQLAGVRNRIINGGCAVAQRGTISFVSAAGSFGGPDRFRAIHSATGQFSQSASVLTFGGIARPAVRQTCTEVAAPFPAFNYWSGIAQLIEGFNCFDLANAPINVSFIFNASLAGAYSVALHAPGASKSYATTIVAVANTPMRVSIAIPAGALTIARNNTTGLRLQVGSLAAVEARTTVLNVWQTTGNIQGASPVVNWAGTLNAFIELTELQLELGTEATTFERLSYGAELALCQRYYEVLGGDSNGTMMLSGIATAAGQMVYETFGLKVQKRAIPTTALLGVWPASNATSLGLGTAGVDCVRVNISAVAAGEFYVINNGAGCFITLNAEL